MTIVLGNEGIKELRSYLELLKGNLASTVKKCEDAIAERGKLYMMSFSPQVWVDGNIAGTVDIERDAELVRVSYIGQDVAYIEFGTGYIGETNPYPDQIVLNDAQWVYDVNNHGLSGWVYHRKDGSGAEFSVGEKPFAPVLNSYERTRQEVVGILREVLSAEFGQ